MSSKVGAVAIVAVGYLLASTYIPQWYSLTPGGRSGANALDTKRDQLLNRYDEFYKEATAWNTAVQPSHDEANNKDPAERYFTLITDFFGKHHVCVLRCTV